MFAEVLLSSGLALVGKPFFKDTHAPPPASGGLGIMHTPIGYLGQLVPNMLYTSYMYGNYYLGKDNPRHLTNANVMLMATACAALTTLVLKHAVRQQRPNGRARNSFPSGHATTAFTFASVVTARHGWYAGLPAYLLASLVGYQRISGKAHYFHDVLAGAMIGVFFGAKINDVSERKSKSHFYLAPLVAQGIMASYVYEI